jgi:Amt family ammonium transporter
VCAAVACYFAIRFRVRREWDDALDVWGVHGIGGGLGTILTGVFAFAAINRASGLFAGNAQQFVVQIVGVLIAAVYAFVVTYLILKAIDRIVPVRVSEEVEAQGLDEVLHGEPAYQPMPTLSSAAAAHLHQPQ